jgi:hypothetical protein
MKRLHSHLAFFGPSELPMEADLRTNIKRLGKPNPFTSWHKACEYIAERFKSGEVEDGNDGFLVDPTTKRVVIRFAVRMESDSDDKSWKEGDAWKTVTSSRLDDGRCLVELSNTRDFAWELLDGAKREVPFRLNYLERNAERKSWCKSLLMELQKYRDMFGRPSF